MATAVVMMMRSAVQVCAGYMMLSSVFTLLLSAAAIGLARAQGEDVNSINNLRSTVDFTASNDFGPVPTATSVITDAVITSPTLSPTETGFMTTAGEGGTTSAGGFSIQTETSLSTTASETEAPSETSSAAAPSATENAAPAGNQKGLVGVGLGVVVGLVGVL